VLSALWSIVDAGGRNHIVWGEGDSFTGPGGTWYTSGPG
jgi:hypothetical protein